MKKRALLISVICLTIAAIAYFSRQFTETPPQKNLSKAQQKSPPPAQVSRAAPGKIAFSAPSLLQTGDTSSHPSAISFGSDPSKASDEAAQLFRLFDFYRESFGSFPSGEGNAQFMNALRGNNPDSLPIFPNKHPRLSSDGEILDFWGKAFFFHQISANQIEIRSSGPDRELYTPDDIVAPQLRSESPAAD
jgi:hypothetical protein